MSCLTFRVFVLECKRKLHVHVHREAEKNGTNFFVCIVFNA